MSPLHRLVATLGVAVIMRTGIIPHLASRLKPVNAPGDRVSSCNVAQSWSETRPHMARISRPLLHCCNTRHAIEAESLLRMPHRLYFVSQKIKINSQAGTRY